MACGTSHKIAKQMDNLDGSWVLAIFMPEQKKTLAEIFGTRAVDIQFDKATHGVSGSTGCNRFMSKYTADTASLQFSGNRVLTKMACGDYNEQTFLNALDQVNRYRIAEGQLELLQNNDIVMVFARKQPWWVFRKLFVKGKLWNSHHYLNNKGRVLLKNFICFDGRYVTTVCFKFWYRILYRKSKLLYYGST